MKSQIAFVVFTLCASAFADVDAQFARMRDGAETVANLGVFLDKFSGTCGPECRAQTQKFRGEATGKKHYIIVSEDAALFSMGPTNPSSGDFILYLTPIFTAAGSALTQGAPTKSDAQGNPVLPYMQIKSRVPDPLDLAMMSRLVSTKGLKVQVIFTPQGVWQMANKKGGKWVGVKARIDGLLVTVARSGEPIGVWINNNS